MRLLPLAALVAPLLVASRANAAEPDGTLAFFAGAATNVAGMIVGGTLLGTSYGNHPLNNAGWLTMCGGFTLSPIVAHGVVDEWGRGLVFASVPAAMTGGTAVLFQQVPDTVNSGSLGQQRIMWGFFGAAFLASTVGIIDATFAAKRLRALTITPTVGSRIIGFQLGGQL